MRTGYKIQILVVLLFLVCSACKHKKVQVTAVQKKAVKKPVNAKPPVKNTTETPRNEVVVSNSLEQKTGLSSNEIKDKKLYSFINDWYGVPYKYGGCQKTGIDCSCFANLLYDKVYGKKITRSAAEMFLQCEKVSLEDAKEGDLFFFRMNGTSITHVGVFLKNKLFVHSSTSKGVIINSVEEAYYKKYFFCAGKMKSL